jgi:hypothetical protein
MSDIIETNPLNHDMDSNSDPLKIKKKKLFSDDFLTISARLFELLLLISQCEQPVSVLYF